MNRNELITAIQDAMTDVWVKYEDSIGVEYGNVFPDIEIAIDGLQEQIADLMILNFKVMMEEEDTPTAPVEHEMDFKGFTESEREDFEAWDDFLGFDEHTTVIESRDGSRKYKISDLHFDPTYVDSIEELMKVVRTDLAEWRRDGALV